MIRATCDRCKTWVEANGWEEAEDLTDSWAERDGEYLCGSCRSRQEAKDAAAYEEDRSIQGVRL